MFSESTFYAVPINSDHAVIKGYRAPYFYLHGEAEKRHGYDICNANGEALSSALRDGGFLCNIEFQDGTVEPGICFNRFEFKKMEGLVVLLSDDNNIRDAVSYLRFKETPSFDWSEEMYLRSINKWDLIKILNNKNIKK
jgi:hypothetical protein